MTRKDYTAIARVLGGIENTRDRYAATRQMAEYCHGENHRFDPDKFAQEVEQEAAKHRARLNTTKRAKPNAKGDRS